MNLNEAIRKRKNTRVVWERIKRLNIEVTNRCQANCVFCFREEFKINVKPKTMSLFNVRKYINEISSFSDKMFGGLDVINLGNNGEPLLHPDIDKIVRYAKDKCKIVRISTNLDLLDEKMSYKLLDSGLGSICFSIDAVDKKMFESIRIGLNWEITLSNAMYFKQIRDKGKYKCKIYVNPVSCKENEGKEKEIIRFWNKISDSRVKMSREIPIGIVDRIQPWYNPKSIPPCTNMVGLKANGDVLPCCYDVFSDFPLGNINDERFELIFYGKKIKELRYRLKHFEEIPYHCLICVGLPRMIRKIINNDKF